MPENGMNIHNSDFDFFENWMRDYDFQNKFWIWYREKKWWWNTACLIGIRTQESLDRWRTIFWDGRVFKYKNVSYSKNVGPWVFNFYPIYDWKVSDVWVANNKFSFEYNKVYDLFYQAWVPVNSMRVASPFNNCATSSLKLYKAIDPDSWWRMLFRVNGVNFAWLYWDTIAMWWRRIKLPNWQTWKTYLDFLLTTLPKETKENYLDKLNVSKKFWEEKWWVLSDEIINELKKRKIKLVIWGKTNYKTTKRPVKMKYIDDIDIKNFKDIPSYKRICVCILKNDHTCRYMWFWLTKVEKEKRDNALKNYSNIYSK
jgi:predicted phosphoadenosine phosphosulfate sulfurtransferase